MRVKIDEIRKLCENALVKKGVPKDEAKVIVDEYVEGDLQGKMTHGLIAFPAMTEGIHVPEEKWKVEKESSSAVFVDGKGNFGMTVGKALMEPLCKKAKKEGISFAAISNITTFLRPRSIAQLVAEKEMIGMVLINGGSEMVVPEGGIDRMLGTNPVGIGIPTDRGPMVFDLATSKRAYGEITLSKMMKRLLPNETFIDKNGNFTTNPDDAYAIVPMGGYKGFALGLFFEILTGSLVSMPMGVRGVTADYRKRYRGAVIIVIDPSFFTDMKEFKARNSELVAQIKASRKAKGVSEIILPGEHARKLREENLSKGYLELDDALLEKIKSMG